MSLDTLTPEAALRTLDELSSGLARLQAYFQAQSRPAPEIPAAAAPPPLPPSTPAPGWPAATLAAATAPKEELVDGELLKRREKLAELEARIAEVETKLHQANQELSEREANLAAITALQAKEDAARQELEGAAEKARHDIAAAVSSKDVLAEVERRRTEMVTEGEALQRRQAETEQAAAGVEAWRAAAEAARHMKEKLWPAWLRAGELAMWTEKLETAIGSGEATPAAALLFAAVHGYTAATKDSDPKLLFDSLREVGRRLLAWFKENGQDEAAAVETAERFAAEINRELAGRAEIELPHPGAPATNSWMIFRPRPGNADVLSVQTWCVRNAQKQPMHRAEVTV